MIFKVFKHLFEGALFMQIFMEYSVSHTVTSRELVRASSTVSGSHTLKERSFMEEKTTRIEIRLTPKEKEKIKNLAASCNLSTSEYLRQRALGFVPNMVQPDVFYLFYNQLCAFCNSIENNATAETEQLIINLAKDIHTQLLTTQKQNKKEIVREVKQWQQQASGQ